MDETTSFLIILGVFLCVVIALAIYFAIKIKKLVPNVPEESPPPELLPDTEPEFKEIPARVIAKKQSESYSGLRVAKYIADYTVTFLTEDNEEIEFRVSQGYYNALKENDEGLLVTVNGNFLDFGSGQELT